MGARKTARRSTCPTVEQQLHLASNFGTQRPHVSRRQRWGNSQAEGGRTRKFTASTSKAKGRVIHTACAVIGPGQAKAPTTPTGINTFHCTYGHTHEGLLKKTAEQQGVDLSGELHECRGCSMVKGRRKPITRSTQISADKKLQQVFVDLSRKMIIPSIGGSGTHSLGGMHAHDLHECTSWARSRTQPVRSSHS